MPAVPAAELDIQPSVPLCFSDEPGIQSTGVTLKLQPPFRNKAANANEFLQSPPAAPSLGCSPASAEQGSGVSWVSVSSSFLQFHGYLGFRGWPVDPVHTLLPTVLGGSVCACS